MSAAILLRREGGYEYTVLWLNCQGIELILKSLLLMADYDKFFKKLRLYGHDLSSLSEVVIQTYGLNAMRTPLRTELDALNVFYQRNLLRYAGSHDIFNDGQSIESKKVKYRICACVRLSKRRFNTDAI